MPMTNEPKSETLITRGLLLLIAANVSKDPYSTVFFATCATIVGVFVLITLIREIKNF